MSAPSETPRSTYPEDADVADPFDSREFYELCQTYRHMRDYGPIGAPVLVVEAFEAIKDFGKVHANRHTLKLAEALARYNRLRYMLEDRSDVRDGSEGRQFPNEAMSILADFDREQGTSGRDRPRVSVSEIHDEVERKEFEAWLRITAREHYHAGERAMAWAAWQASAGRFEGAPIPPDRLTSHKEKT